VFTDPCGVDAWRLGESDLVAVTRAVGAQLVQLEALRVRLVAEVESRGTAKALGAGSTAAWLSGMSRMSPGAATGIVNLGKALAERPETAAALAGGAISTAHARVIVGFFVHLPDGVPRQAHGECEAYLLQAAATDNPAELARRAAALRHLLEPVEHSLPDAENTALNELLAATTLGGRGVVKADLDAETMEMLHTALSGLAKPQPGEDGARDTRSPGLRRAEAFTELLRRYLNSGDTPVEGYERPHLSLLIRAEDLAAAGTPTADQDAGHGQAPVAEPTPRPGADRGAYRGLFGSDPVAPGWMPWMGPISAATARRIACDCALTRIGIDDAGVPLNLGRSSRLVSPAQRRALIARDHGCTFPGCGRPPGWTEAHHIRHWINGGTTDLANLVLLCAHHHRVIHHHGWDITTGPDGHPWFHPPQWLDPHRQPRPAHHRQHHTPTTAA